MANMEFQSKSESYTGSQCVKQSEACKYRQIVPHQVVINQARVLGSWPHTCLVYAQASVNWLHGHVKAFIYLRPRSHKKWPFRAIRK